MKIHFIISILIASAITAGAFAQTYPIHTQPDTIASQSPTIENHDTLSIDSVFLNLIKVVEQLPASPDELNDTGLGALDFLSSAYEDADYYSSGCDTPPSLYNSDTQIFIKELPEHIVSEFCQPIVGSVTSPFGLREDGRRMHKGVDLSLHRGDSIRAAIGGQATRVGYERKGYGYFIIVDHPEGVQTRYAHLQQPLVKPGDIINPGKIIAIGGTSGNSTGPHLHFEIRCQGKPLDPTPLLQPRK